MEDIAGARSLLETISGLKDDADIDINYGCLLYKVKPSFNVIDVDLLRLSNRNGFVFAYYSRKIGMKKRYRNF